MNNLDNNDSFISFDPGKSIYTPSDMVRNEVAIGMLMGKHNECEKENKELRNQISALLTCIDSYGSTPLITLICSLFNFAITIGIAIIVNLFTAGSLSGIMAAALITIFTVMFFLCQYLPNRYIVRAIRKAGCGEKD